MIGSGSILGEGVTCVCAQKLEGKLVRREGKDISDMFIQGKSEEKGLWEFHISCSTYRLGPKMFTMAIVIRSYIFLTVLPVFTLSKSA